MNACSRARLFTQNCALCIEPGREQRTREPMPGALPVQAGGEEEEKPAGSASHCGQRERVHAGCLGKCSAAGGQAKGLDVL